MAAKNTPGNGALDSFTWDNPEEASFFGIGGETEKPLDQQVKEAKVKVPIEGEPAPVEDDDDEDDVTKIGDEEDTEEEEGGEAGKDKGKKKNAKKKPDAAAEPEAKFENFGEAQGGDNDGQGAETQATPADNTKFFTTLAKELKDQKIFQNVELKEGEDITEERFFELQDAEIEARVDETFEAFFEELDEDGKAFLKFKKEKGSTADFLATYQGTQMADYPEFDLKDAGERREVIAAYLRAYEQMDEAEIKDRIDWMVEGGKDETYAKKYDAKMREDAKKTREQLLAKQIEAQKVREEGVKQFTKEIKEALTKVAKVGSFTFTDADRKELGDYVTKPNAKTGKATYIPQFNKDLGEILRAKTPEAKEKLLLLAKLIKSGFDVKDLVAATTTAATRKVRSSLKQAKENPNPSSSSSGNTGTGKSLSDFFN